MFSFAKRVPTWTSDDDTTVIVVPTKVPVAPTQAALRAFSVPQNSVHQRRRTRTPVAQLQRRREGEVHVLQTAVSNEPVFVQFSSCFD